MQSDRLDETSAFTELLKDSLTGFESEPIVCRVEVDLKGWMRELTGGQDWEVCDEQENELATTFNLRHGMRNAEITLYQTGHALVDIDGNAIFDGNLTEQKGRWTQLSYFNALNGEPITLN